MAPLDTSIYQGVGVDPNSIKGPADFAKDAMSMGEMMRQYQTQQAMRDAFAKNTDASGKLDRPAALSAIGRVNPMAAMQLGQSMNKMDKEQAEAQTAQADATMKRANIFARHMDYLNTVPDDQKPQAYGNIVKMLKAQNVITPDQGIPDQYDPTFANAMMAKAAQHIGQNSQGYLEAEKTKSDIGLVPLKKQNEQYGSRSPNAELTSQYNDQVKPIRSSQMAMQQMIDNYKNPSPQGDASLVLNAFKIKFPNAPDVNSLEELAKSQSASDTWKNLAHQAISGGLDVGTRDNLMRDGVSTFRANVDTFRGIQDRFKQRQGFQGVNDPTLTVEPAIENTYKGAMGLQDKIGPYVPPTERGGFMGGVTKLASSALGLAGGRAKKSQDTDSAYAGAKPSATMTPKQAEALDWLSKNQGHPHAAAVKAKLQKEGVL